MDEATEDRGRPEDFYRMLIHHPTTGQPVVCFSGPSADLIGHGAIEAFKAITAITAPQ